VAIEFCLKYNIDCHYSLAGHRSPQALFASGAPWVLSVGSAFFFFFVAISFSFYHAILFFDLSVTWRLQKLLLQDVNYANHANMLIANNNNNNLSCFCIILLLVLLKILWKRKCRENIGNSRENKPRKYAERGGPKEIGFFFSFSFFRFCFICFFLFLLSNEIWHFSKSVCTSHKYSSVHMRNCMQFYCVVSLNYDQPRSSRVCISLRTLNSTFVCMMLFVCFDHVYRTFSLDSLRGLWIRRCVGTQWCLRNTTSLACQRCLFSSFSTHSVMSSVRIFVPPNLLHRCRVWHVSLGNPLENLQLPLVFAVLMKV